MSLKFGLTIGAIFTGASAFRTSEGAIKSLDLRLIKLNQKRLALKSNTSGLKKVRAEISLISGALNKLESRKLKMDGILAGRDKFKASLMDKVVLAGSVIAPLAVAIEFESAMADVKKVVNFDNNEELAAFQNQITKLSTKIPLSAKGLASIVASGGQLGIAKDKLLDFTTITAKMSTAFDMLPEEAGDSSAKLMNVFGLTVDGVSSLGDAINHLSDNSASKARYIVDVLGRIGGTAKVFGLSAKAASSLSGAFLALGKPSEVAATAINALLLKLGTADKQGNKFQNALADIGLSAQELKANIAQDGEGAIIGFLQTLNTLDDSEKLGVLTDLFGMEYADDIALLSGGIDNYTKSISLLADEQKYAGSMQREFEARSKTTANNLIRLKSSVSRIAINLGGLLLPALNSIITPISTFSGWIADLVTQFPTISSGVAGLAVGGIALSVSFSVLAYAGSFLLGGFLKIKSVATLLGLGFKLLALKTGIATKAQWLFNAATKANPIGAVITLLAALGAGAVYLYKNFEPFSNFVDSIWTKLKGFFSFVTSGWTAVGSIIGSLGSYLGFGDDEAGLTLPKKTTVAFASAAALSAPMAMAVPTPPPTSVQQAITMHVTVNNPSSNVDVERAIANAMRDRSSISLTDEVI